MPGQATGEPNHGLRLTSLTVRNLRTLAEVTLPLGGLQVLIGENGAGKSSLLEALEILRVAGSSASFLEDLQKYHGLVGLLRRGEVFLGLLVEGQAADGEYKYQLELGNAGAGTGIATESFSILRPTGTRVCYIDRDQTSARVADDKLVLQTADSFNPNSLVLRSWGERPPHAAIFRMVDALARIQVHLPFHTLPPWAARRRAEQDLIRLPAIVAPAAHVDLLGVNLVNAWNTINSRGPAREEGLRRVRLGLGLDVKEMRTEPDGEWGRVRLHLLLDDGTEMPLGWLSEGQIAYLGFVALSLLPDRASLIAFDEVDTHLHPSLLMRVLDLFRGLAKERPVLLTTHSDALLDGLGDEAADAAVLFEMGENRRTALRFPDKAYLAQFLARFNGLGDMLARGYGRDALSEPARQP